MKNLAFRIWQYVGFILILITTFGWALDRANTLTIISISLAVFSIFISKFEAKWAVPASSASLVIAVFFMFNVYLLTGRSIGDRMLANLLAVVFFSGLALVVWRTIRDEPRS
jgi:amino acid permease